MLLSSATHNAKKTFALIIALFALLLIAVFYAWQALLTAEQEQARARLQLESNSLAKQIESRFQQQATTLVRMAQRWEFQHGKPDLWQSDAKRLLRLSEGAPQLPTTGQSTSYRPAAT